MLLYVYEFYTTLRREFDEPTAKKYVDVLENCIVEISIQNVMEAVEMKIRNKKSNVSFIDCIGYSKVH